MSEVKKIKAFFAVDPDGQENIFTCKPKRHNNGICSLWTTMGKGKKIPVPIGRFKNATGFSMTWENDPVNINIDDFEKQMK